MSSPYLFGQEIRLNAYPVRLSIVTSFKDALSFQLSVLNLKNQEKKDQTLISEYLLSSLRFIFLEEEPFELVHELVDIPELSVN